MGFEQCPFVWDVEWNVRSAKILRNGPGSEVGWVFVLYDGIYEEGKCSDWYFLDVAVFGIL